MKKIKNAVKYMIDVWDEVTSETWRERPDHVQQKFLEAEEELLSGILESPDNIVVGNKLRKEIEQVLNKHSAESASDTPDFILAEYLTDCLKAFDRAVVRRDEWCDRYKYNTISKL